MTEKKVYFNKPQRLTQLIGANPTVIVVLLSPDEEQAKRLPQRQIRRNTFAHSVSGVS